MIHSSHFLAHLPEAVLIYFASGSQMYAGCLLDFEL